MVDHFQHIIYEKPELTPEQRHDVWSELMKEYMPWIRLDGSPFYGEGKGWQRQIHIYENPFYYVDYCLAQTVAFEFWILMQENHDNAWEKYMSLVRNAGTQTFTELIKSIGLKSQFDENTLKEVSEYVVQWLNDNTL